MFLCQWKKSDVVGFMILDGGMVVESVYLDIQVLLWGKSANVKQYKKKIKESSYSFMLLGNLELMTI